VREDLNNGLLAVCKLLEKHTVQYLLVGGTAVALNGYFRYSVNAEGELADKPDIDIWYNPTYENYFNVLKVIKDLGKDINEFTSEQNPNPKKSFFKLEFDEFSLDMLPEIKAVIRFAEASRNKETVQFEGTKIHFLNYFDLIKDKEATARKKDLEDIQNLKRINGDE